MHAKCLKLTDIIQSITDNTSNSLWLASQIMHGSGIYKILRSHVFILGVFYNNDEVDRVKDEACIDTNGAHIYIS